MGRDVVGRYHRLGRRIGRYNHRAIVRLGLKVTGRELHMAIGRIPRRELLRRICWGHVAVHAVHAVHTVHTVHAVHAIHTVHVWRIGHVRRGAHVRMTRVVGKVLLPPPLRHRRLPMRHGR